MIALIELALAGPHSRSWIIGKTAFRKKYVTWFLRFYKVFHRQSNQNCILPDRFGHRLIPFNITKHIEASISMFFWNFLFWISTLHSLKLVELRFIVHCFKYWTLKSIYSTRHVPIMFFLKVGNMKMQYSLKKCMMIRSGVELVMSPRSYQSCESPRSFLILQIPRTF